MTRSFFIAVVLGIVFLGVFTYFIFGLYGKPLDQPKQEQAKQEQTKMDKAQTQQLKIEDITEGTGAQVKSGDTITIDYLGTLPDGTKFDSSYDRGEPFQTKIGVGQVIEGWDRGVIGMKVGGKRKLTIPPALGYGEQAIGSIPANSTLIFEVELKAIK